MKNKQLLSDFSVSSFIPNTLVFSASKNDKNGNTCKAPHFMK